MSDAQRRRSRHERIRARWTPPGPVPPGDQGDPTLRPGPEETLDHVSGHWRIFQRRDGHRFSTDDFLCAWYAVRRARARGLDVRRYLDLGTGIGSVALMTSWHFPEAQVIGVEVQEVSAGLARRSVRYNGLEERFEVHHRDLREFQVTEPERFDLITGSPPYLPVGTGIESGRVQRAPARFVFKGDVTDYARAAARCLTPGGVFVLVFAAYRPDDVPAAADAAGLAIRARRLVVPRAGKDPLLELLELGFPGESAADDPVPPLVIRDGAGQWTADYRAVRAEMGFPG